MEEQRPTRYYSDMQEKAVSKLLGGQQVSNSGAGLFCKSDVIVKSASLAVECKTSVKEKDSFTVKKSWVKKNKDECFQNRMAYTALAFNFGPGQENYFMINEKLMSFLCDKLKEEGE